MSKSKVVYVVVSGAVSIQVVPEMVQQLSQFERPVYTFLTDSARRLISPWRLAQQPGHRLVNSYFDPVLTPERKAGVTLVAPATFNTVNKLGQGIADTLPHSLAAEAIGAGWPVIIAPCLNSALANHPRYKQSVETLRSWGVTILDPRREGDSLLMASVETVVSAVESINFKI